MKEEDEVRIIVGEKTVRTLRGKEAKAALKAIELVLSTVRSHKKIKIDVIDAGLPENFSYAKALNEALKDGLENPIEIADHILKKLKKEKHAIV